MSVLLRIAKKVLPKPKGENRIRLQKAFMRFCRVFPINKKKVVLSSFFGSRCADNPKSIFIEMLKQRPDWKYIWVLPDETIKIPQAKVIKTGSFDAIFHLATAGLWIDNCRKDYWLVKRKKQYYVQTWHANVGLKKAEKDAKDTLSEDYLKCCHNDSKMADLFISGSKWNAQNYRDAYWYDGDILMLGTPRSDIFYQDHEPYHRKVCEFYGVSEQTHFCLYAPTFRNSGTLDCYNIDCMKLKKTLESKWGGEWRILIRLHPNIQHEQKEIEYSEEVLNASTYQEINELIVASDILISDYSSCMFDAMEAGKRVVIYASDVTAFLKEREFYFALEELPFPLSQSNEELNRAIEEFDDDLYLQKCNALVAELGICDGPDSAAKVAKYIIRKVEGKRRG